MFSKPTMRLWVSSPLFGSLNGKCRSFPGGCCRYLQTHIVSVKNHRVGPNFGPASGLQFRDFQTNCWANLKILGQSCKILRGGGRGGPAAGGHAHGQGEGEPRDGVRARSHASLFTTAHLLYTRVIDVFGASISEATMRPNPRWCSAR